MLVKVSCFLLLLASYDTSKKNIRVTISISNESSLKTRRNIGSNGMKTDNTVTNLPFSFVYILHCHSKLLLLIIAEVLIVSGSYLFIYFVQ